MQQGQETIEILNLNHRDLINRRTELLKLIQDYLKAFNICENIYQMKRNSDFKDSFLELVKNFPQYRELEYIVNKVT